MSRLEVPAPRLSSWKLVVAAFLHFGIIGYLIFVVPLSLLLAPTGAGAADVARLGLRLSAVFLLAFLALGVASVAVAAASDRRKRRSSSSEAAVARQRVASALEVARHACDSTARPLLESIAARTWMYDDDRYQALARDLDIVVTTALAALADAPGEQADALRKQTTRSVIMIDQTLADLERARANDASSDARAAALYIQRRYGSSDFTIKPD